MRMSEKRAKAPRAEATITEAYTSPEPLLWGVVPPVSCDAGALCPSIGIWCDCAPSFEGPGGIATDPSACEAPRRPWHIRKNTTVARAKIRRPLDLVRLWKKIRFTNLIVSGGYGRFVILQTPGAASEDRPGVFPPCRHQSPLRGSPNTPATHYRRGFSQDLLALTCSCILLHSTS